MSKVGLLRTRDTGVEAKEAKEEEGLKVTVNGVMSLRKAREHRIRNTIFMKKNILYAKPRCKLWMPQKILPMISAKTFLSLSHPPGDSLTQSLGNPPFTQDSFTFCMILLIKHTTNR